MVEGREEQVLANFGEFGIALAVAQRAFVRVLDARLLPALVDHVVLSRTDEASFEVGDHVMGEIGRVLEHAHPVRKKIVEPGYHVANALGFTCLHYPSSPVTRNVVFIEVVPGAGDGAFGQEVEHGQIRKGEEGLAGRGVLADHAKLVVDVPGFQGRDPDPSAG